MEQVITERISFPVVGLDLGKRVSHVFVLGKGGTVEHEGSLESSRESFKAFFKLLPNANVIFEAGSQALWVNALLSELGHQALPVNPRELPQIYQTKKKSDRIDAQKLAELGFTPNLPVVELRSLENYADLAVVRSRAVLVDTRTKLVNHVRGICSSFGTNLKKCDASYFHRHAPGQVPEALKPAVDPVINEIKSVTAAIKSLDKTINAICKIRCPETDRLKTVPGVAELTALAYVLTIIRPERFGSSRKVGAYVGLVPKLDQSCGRNPQLRITRAGDPYLRKLLITAAHQILGGNGRDCALRRYGHRICPEGSSNRGAKKRAIVAVARKLSILLHHLWQSRERFTPFPDGEPEPKVAVA